MSSKNARTMLKIHYDNSIQISNYGTTFNLERTQFDIYIYIYPLCMGLQLILYFERAKKVISTALACFCVVYTVLHDYQLVTVVASFCRLFVVGFGKFDPVALVAAAVTTSLFSSALSSVFVCRFLESPMVPVIVDATLQG
jgi:hypothetical protein